MGLGPLGNLWLHRGAAEINFSPKFIKARNRTNKKTELSLKKLFFSIGEAKWLLVVLVREVCGTKYHQQGASKAEMYLLTVWRLEV